MSRALPRRGDVLWPLIVRRYKSRSASPLGSVRPLMEDICVGRGTKDELPTESGGRVCL
jgi:hypothetical protein